VWTVFGAILLIVSVCDFLFFRIENEYSLALLILYAISFVCGTSGSNFVEGLTIAAATFVVTAILNRFNLIGGGDVKLLFPAILLCENSLSTFWFGLSVGGIALAVVYLIFGQGIFSARQKLIRRLFELSEKPDGYPSLNVILLSLGRVNKRIVESKKPTLSSMRREIPYGIAIACGGFCAIFESLAVR
jgi:Flp pilus assembly protein protease CpaA